MQSTSKFKKFLLPGIIILVIAVVGLVVWKGKTTDAQQASITQAQIFACQYGNTTPKIQVLSPNGGETFTAGQQITVKWGKCNIPSTEIVEITLNQGSNVYSLVSNTQNVLASTGQVTVTLPTQSNWPQFQPGNLYRVAIYATHAPFAVAIAQDFSNNLFTINNEPSLVLTQISTSQVATTNPGANNDTGTFTIKFNVTANGADAYISKIAPNGLIYQFDRAGTATTVGNAVLIANSPVATTAYNFKISNGQTVTFTLTGTVSLPAAGVASQYRMSMKGTRWALTDIPAYYPNSVMVNPNYNTSYITLN